MRFRFSASILLSFFIFLTLQPLSAASTDTTSVIGFINLGEGGDDVGPILTRSFIVYFSRLPGAKITPFSASDNLARTKGYLALKKPDNALAIQLGQTLNCRQVVTGSYRVDEAKATIVMEVVALDTATGELRFKRRYEGKAGPALLDTIEDVRKSVAGLFAGREVPMAMLEVTVTNAKTAYEVTLGGTPDGDAAPVYKKSLPAGQSMDVALRRKSDNFEVFRTNITLKAGEASRILYYPTAPVLIQSAKPDCEVRVNGKVLGIATTNATFSLNGLPAGQIHTLYLQNTLYRSQVRKFALTEGVPGLYSFDPNEFYARSRYSSVAPVWSLFLPGLSQFMANDAVAGSVFSVLGAVDIGFVVYCMMQYSTNEALSRNTDLSDTYRASAAIYRDTFGYAAIGGGVIWAGLAIGSFLHANAMKQAEELGQTWSVSFVPMAEPGMGLAFSCRLD